MQRSDLPEKLMKDVKKTEWTSGLMREAAARISLLETDISQMEAEIDRLRATRDDAWSALEAALKELAGRHIDLCRYRTGGTCNCGLREAEAEIAALAAP